MSLEGRAQVHLRAATGYIELEMFEEANAELEEIDPLYRHLPEVLLARLAIYHGLKKWELLVVVARKLVDWKESLRSLDRTTVPVRAIIARRSRNRSRRCPAQHKIASATPASAVTRTELRLAEFRCESVGEKIDAASRTVVLLARPSIKGFVIS
jgi:hypothetical protein